MRQLLEALMILLDLEPSPRRLEAGKRRRLRERLDYIFFMDALEGQLDNMSRRRFR